MNKTESNRRYYLKNRERLKAATAAYRERNYDKVIAYDRQRYPLRRTDDLKRLHAYYMEHKEEKHRYNLIYRERNKERLRAYSKAYRQTNRLKIRIRNRIYQRQNPEKVRQWKQRYERKKLLGYANN